MAAEFPQWISYVEKPAESWRPFKLLAKNSVAAPPPEEQTPIVPRVGLGAGVEEAMAQERYKTAALEEENARLRSVISGLNIQVSALTDMLRSRA